MYFSKCSQKLEIRVITLYIAIWISQCSPNTFLQYIDRWSSTRCRMYVANYYVVNSKNIPLLFKPVNHTSWVAVVTPTDRPKSVRNRCLIELFCGVVCVVTLPFWHFCWCRGFCHRTESDLFLFLLQCIIKLSIWFDRHEERITNININIDIVTIKCLQSGRDPIDWVSEITCKDFTSHPMIVPLYMWRHIDVQADWKKKFDLQFGSNATDN